MSESVDQIWSGLSVAMRHELCYRAGVPVPVVAGAVGTVATVRALVRRGLLTQRPHRVTRLGRRVARYGTAGGATDG